MHLHWHLLQALCYPERMHAAIVWMLCSFGSGVAQSGLAAWWDAAVGMRRFFYAADEMSDTDQQATFLQGTALQSTY